MFYCIGGGVSRLAILTSRLYNLRMVFSLGKMSPKLHPYHIIVKSVSGLSYCVM